MERLKLRQGSLVAPQQLDTNLQVRMKERQKSHQLPLINRPTLDRATTRA